MTKRIISIALALCTLISFASASVCAITIEKFEDNNNFTIIPFVDPPTTGKEIFETFKANTEVELGDGISTPMGNNPVTLYEASEIFTWATRDSAVLGHTGFYDVVQDYTDEKGTYFKESNQRANLSSQLDDLLYANGVAFDPTGCGRRNYVAVLGFHSTGGDTANGIYLYVINGDTNTVVSKAVETSNLWWLINDSGEIQLDNVDGNNFFQITAGDYDNDGKDSLIIYYGQPKISEYKLIFGSNGTVTVSQTTSNIITDNTPYLNTSYMMVDSLGNAMYKSGIAYRANVSLETGDVNGDGIDDLAVVSCVGDYDEDRLSYYSVRKNNPCKATLAVGFGKTNGSLKTADVATDIIYDSSTNMTVAAPGVSIGDIDGDGNREIVVAGFLNKSTESDKINLQKGSVGFTYYKASGKTISQYGGLQTISKISANSKGDSVRETESLWQQFSVECVAFNGLNTKEYIFLNGYVYLMDTTNKTLEHISIKGWGDNEIFESLTNKWKPTKDSYDFNEVYIASAAVGNFNNNTSGEKAIYLTVGYKVNNSNKYCFADVLIEKRGGKLVCSSKHDCHYVNEGYLMDLSVYNKSEGKSGVSYIHVAADIDHDSCVAQYAGSEAFYSDPSVVAFLQAAPYFSELEAGNSSTKYSYSETYENSVASGYEFAVGVGITAETETSAVKFKVEEAVSTGITNEFTESRSQEYTTTFEANGQNQVVLRRMLICTYYYALQDESGKYETDPNNYLAITVPQNPCISTLSLEQYNMYVDYYNDQCAKYKGSYEGTDYFKNTLNKVNDETLLAKYHISDNEGNPYGYASSIGDYAKSVTMVKDNTWITLGHAGGVTTQEFSYTKGIEETECTSAGVEVNMELMFGASFAGNGAYAGVKASMEYVTTKTKTTSQLKTVGTGGTVQNLESDMTDYDFQWQLIGWKAANGDTLFNNDVLFVGYAVKNIKSLPQPVDDLTATYLGDADGNLVLKWTSPKIRTGRQAIKRFNIYFGDSKVSMDYVENSGEEKEHTYTIDAGKYSDALVSFHIKCIGTNGDKSLPSNTAECILALNEAQVKKLISKAIDDLNIGIDDLKTALETKADAADLTKAIEDVTSAYKAADELLGADIEGIEVELSSLSDAMNEAHETLYKAIDAVQENLDNASKELKETIADGDSQNAKALTEAVSELTEAYKSADSLLESDIDAIKKELSKLGTSTTEADEALKEAVKAVQEKLGSTVEELKKAIASGDAQSTEALTEAISELTEAYKAADLLLKSDVDALKEGLSELSAAMSNAHSSLKDAIDLVQKNLNDVTAELEKAINDGDSVNAEELAKLSALLAETYKKSEEVLKAEIDKLKGELDSSNQNASAEIASLKELIDMLKGELDSSKENSASEISSLQEQIDALKEGLGSQGEDSNSEITALKSEIEKIKSENSEHDTYMEELTEENEQMAEKITTLKTFAYIGFGVSVTSLLANAALIITEVIKKKKLLGAVH